MFSFTEPAKQSSKVSPHLLATGARLSSCCHVSAPALGVGVLGLGHAVRCEDRVHYCFNFQYSEIYIRVSIFHKPFVQSNHF